MFKKLSLIIAAILFTLLPFSKVFGATTPNLIPNPSMETATTGTVPDGWLNSAWGGSQASSTFSYEATGHDSARSIKVQTTDHATAGAANWYYSPSITVTPGQAYQYENWYISDVSTEAGAEFTMADGTTQYVYLGAISPSTVWAKFMTTFTAPANSSSVKVSQVLAAVGSLTTDDYSLTAYTPTPLNHPIVSVAFDDGWSNQFTNARPIMQANGLVGTYFILSGVLNNQPDYMTPGQVQTLYADGNEIGSHTVHHCDLVGVLNDDPQNCTTPILDADLQKEMVDSKTSLEALTGSPVTSFAYPYGSYSAKTISAGQQAGYVSQRTVDRGYNTKDSLDLTKLKVYEVDSVNTTAEVKSWIDGAISQNAWLVLVYHEIADVPAQPDDALYTTKPTDFADQMAYIKTQMTSTNLVNKTVAAAVTDITTTVIIPPVVKPGDMNGDNVVDALDLSVLLTNWNKTSATAVQGDVNSDGVIDALDLSVLLTNWSK